MASSEGGATTKGCFSAILSRLLCSGSLPTHPSEHLPQLTSSTESTHQPNKAPITESKPIDQSTPGIVARLMGLDPFPDSASFSRRRTLDSILRSRSVNFVDYYLPNLDSTKQAQDKAQHEAQGHARHRRVKTSVSFREVPTFLDPQNHELLILCLDQVDEISRKSEISLKEMVRGVKRREKEEKNKKSSKVKEEKPKKDVNGPSPKPKDGNVLGQKKDVHAKPKASLNRKSPVRPTISRTEESVEFKATKKRENGNRSRNSSVKKSPCVLHHESPMPENSRPISSKTSPPRFDKYDDRPCPNLASRLKEDDQELKAIKSKTNQPLKTNESDYFVDMLMEVCRLTEEDTLKQSIWMAGNDELKLEKVEEICIEFEQETLEILLSQLVDEICGSSSQLHLGLNSSL